MRFFFEDERFVSDEPNGIIVLHERDDVHRLILQDVTPEDSGTYSVMARNPDGEQTQSFCTVLVNLRKPTALHVPSEIRVRRGESISIEVESDGSELVWSRDEQLAQPIAPGRFAFNISRVQSGGVVTITAKNESGMISTSTTLVVIDPPPVAPKFLTELPSEMEVTLGQCLPLTVRYAGVAKSIRWTLKDGPLPPLFDVSSNPSEDGGLSQVFIQSMRVEMEGALECHVSNDSGEVTTRCALSYVRVAPEFTSTPVDSLVTYVGNTLVLGCEFGGVPTPTCTWLKEGRPITRGDVTENEAVSKLEVTAVTAEDAGQYLVRIENSAGFAQYSVKVTIPPAPEMPHVSPAECPMQKEQQTPAQIVERLNDKTFAEGEDIILRCRVDGKPTPTGNCWFTFFANLPLSTRLVI